MEIRLAADHNISNRLTLFGWIASFVIIELIWTFVGSAATHLFLEATRNNPWSSNPWVIYVGQHINFLVLFFTILIFVHHAIGLPLLRYVTNALNFRWELFWFSLLVWTAGLTIATMVTAVFEPQAIIFHTTDQLWNRLLLMVLALVLTPLQCITEELLFRTTLWRIMEQRVKRYWIMAVVSGIVFTLAHLTNAEIQGSSNVLSVLLYYFLSGFLFMEMVRIHQGSEAAFGAHIANNLFLVLVINYSGSSLVSDPWFLQQDPLVWLDITVLLLCSTIIIRYGNRIGPKKPSVPRYR
jgi:membrane protease YdiL (CAAX protease family)